MTVSYCGVFPSIRVWRDSAAALNHLSCALCRHPEAIVAYRRALELDPGDKQAAAHLLELALDVDDD